MWAEAAFLNVRLEKPGERNVTDTRSTDYDRPTDATTPADAPTPPDEVDLMPNEARQGVTHHNVRAVLAFSTIGCAVLMGIAYLVFFA